MERKDCKTGTAKYDPTRKYRTGDKVRFIHRGRRNYLVTPENGEECTVIENEKQEQVLIKCCGYTAVFHFVDLELVKPVEEIEKEDTQTCTPDEACCCDTAAEQAPVTVEMIEEAYNHLSDMVNRCQTPVLLHILIEKGDRVSGKNATCAAVTEMPGAKGTEWIAARGYLFAAGTCFSGSPEVVSQGVKLAFEKSHRNVGVNPIAAILGIAGCECEECQD